MKNLIQKYGLYIGLGTLTIVLMIIFKQQGSVVESGTNSLLDFYSQNLRPLFAETDLTREDVINFAFNKNLPLNAEKNRIVELSEDYNNNDIIEVKPASINENVDNYDRFISYLKLNNDQQQQLDSLLDSYKAELNTYLFVSDNNTLAVDPKISLLRDLIMDDLMRFARNVRIQNSTRKTTKLVRIPPSDKALAMRGYISDTKKRDFVFLGEDTTFNATCEIETGRIKRRAISPTIERTAEREEYMKQYVVSEAKPFENVVDAIPGVRVDVDIPSAITRITVAADSIPGIEARTVQEFKKHIEDISRQFTSYAYGISADNDGNSLILKIEDLEEQTEGLNIKLNWSNLQQVITSSISAGLNGEENWESFGLKIDSLASGIISIPDDSLVIISNKVKSSGSKSGSGRNKR